MHQPARQRVRTPPTTLDELFQALEALLLPGCPVPESERAEHWASGDRVAAQVALHLSRTRAGCL